MQPGLFSSVALLLIAVAAPGQTTTSRAPFVRAMGTGTVSIQPDEATLDLSVVTLAQTATAASSQNATQVTSVIGALTSLLGSTASIKTVSYSLVANYSYPANGLPVLTGYTANNTVEATITNLGAIGQAIDTGIQAGANQVAGLTFGLQDDSQARSQALKLATAQASANATSMAGGVGMHTGAVQVISEGTTVTPTPVGIAGTAAGTPTPILSGNLTIQATVTVEVSLTQ
jgi:uncharacterized protein YggE